MDYSVVIPLYNESASLKLLHQRVAQVLDPLSKDYEVIFVDDGSTDASLSILKGIASKDEKVRIISFIKNYGQHPATMAGFEAAKGDLIMTLDADLQNPPEELPRLIEEIKRSDVDMVAGRRISRRDSSLRRFSSLPVNLFFSMLTGVYLKDYGTMLRVIKKDIAKEVARRYRKERLYISVLMSKVTSNISEIGVRHEARISGGSRYNFIKLFKILILAALRYPANFYSLMQRLNIFKKDIEPYSIKFKN